MRARGQSRKQRDARVRARAALPQGTECEQCGSSGRLHRHHDDYDQPLCVRWLCPRCHGAWHALNGPGANRRDDGASEGLGRVAFPRHGLLLGWADRNDEDEKETTR